MNRRIAVVGDSLSSGGTISPYDGPRFLVHGHQAALIGGSAFCPACQSIGTIAKAGGPYRLKFRGEVALDDDVVLCGCSTPPRIVALLAGEAWCSDGLKGLGEVVSSRTTTGGVASIRERRISPASRCDGGQRCHCQARRLSVLHRDCGRTYIQACSMRAASYHASIPVMPQESSPSIGETRPLPNNTEG
ncbi:PAAR domain-containing protein [Burkholderia sp. JP2-270]|uniref:PAAR domain-containing protein n=1 Tax=Burkholderia sp. JP2-270 TaxID=2217913 RepID=UPI001EF98FF4|nr:PAAR domain-containing protein [Burkholderia sp. JP2-270]